MALAEMMGWSNPLTNFVGDHRHALIGLGSGLMQGNWQKGLALGVQGAGKGRVYDDAFAKEKREEAERHQQINQTSEWLRTNYPQYAGLPPAEGFKAALAEMGRQGAGDDNLMSVGGHLYDTTTGQWISPPESAANRQNISLTPQWAQDAQGNWHMLQTSSTGELIQSQVPEGLTLADPRAISLERSLGTKLGGAAGEAMAAAPGDIAAGQTALDIIDQIKTHPELDWATGMSAGLGGNMVPGTGRFGFQNLVDQAKSGAFLTAVQEMRGLGALSNAEGQAATQAITRLNTALSKEDFLRALADYERIVRRGMERAQARLSGSIPGVSPSPSGGTGTTSGGLQWSIEP